MKRLAQQRQHELRLFRPVQWLGCLLHLLLLLHIVASGESNNNGLAANNSSVVVDDECESRHENVQRRAQGPPPILEPRPCASNDYGSFTNYVVVVIDERKYFLASTTEKADYEFFFKDVYNDMVKEKCDDPFFRQVDTISLISPPVAARRRRRLLANEEDEDENENVESARELFQTKDLSLGGTALIFEMTIKCHQNCNMDVDRKTVFGPRAQLRRFLSSADYDMTFANSTRSSSSLSTASSSAAAVHRQLQTTPTPAPATPAPATPAPATPAPATPAPATPAPATPAPATPAPATPAPATPAPATPAPATPAPATPAPATPAPATPAPATPAPATPSPATPQPTANAPLSTLCGSLSARDINYRGTISQTVNGKTCQRWDTNVPHIHDFFSPVNFPNAGLDENFCRNPGSSEPRAWCYTTDPADRFALCYVPNCEGLNDVCGSLSINQVNYRGTISQTATGKTCQRWDAQFPHTHNNTPDAHPSGGLDENFCRNPDGEAKAWCYTTDPGTPRGCCSVPDCFGGDLAAVPCINQGAAPTPQPTPQPSLPPPPPPPSASQPECRCPLNFVGGGRPPLELEFLERYQNALTASFAISEVIELDLGKVNGVRDTSNQRLVYLELTIDDTLRPDLESDQQMDVMKLFEESFNQQSFLNCDSSFRRLRNPLFREQVAQTTDEPYQMIFEFTIDSDGFSSSALELSSNRRLKENDNQDDGTAKGDRRNYTRGLQIDIPNGAGLYCPKHLPKTGLGPSRQQMVALLTENLALVREKHAELSSVQIIVDVIEVTERPCSAPLNTLVSTIKIDLDFPALDMLSIERDVLVQVFVDAYNHLTLENCDNERRQVKFVDFSFDGNTLIFDTTFICNCADGTLLLTHTIRNRERTLRQQLLQQHDENDSGRGKGPQPRTATGNLFGPNTKRKLQLADFAGCYCATRPSMSETAPTEADLQAEIVTRIATLQSNGTLVNFNGNIVDTYEVISAMPTLTPSSSPSASPTSSPTSSPTAVPTSQPTVVPSTSPTADPTSVPSARPSAGPSASPTIRPTGSPSVGPTFDPTASPTVSPGVGPTVPPSVRPTRDPSTTPTKAPTSSPTSVPTAVPSDGPTISPISRPTLPPSLSPTGSPHTTAPTEEDATVTPSVSPTMLPDPRTAFPTKSPGPGPTMSPTTPATPTPTFLPSMGPTTAIPTAVTSLPTVSPFPTITCSVTRRTFGTTVLIEVSERFENGLFIDDARAMESLFAQAYTALSIQFCDDPCYRRVINAELIWPVLSDPGRNLQSNQRALFGGPSDLVFNLTVEHDVACQTIQTAFDRLPTPSSRSLFRVSGEGGNDELIHSRQLQTGSSGGSLCACREDFAGIPRAPHEKEFGNRYQLGLDQIQSGFHVAVGQVQDVIEVERVERDPDVDLFQSLLLVRIRVTDNIADIPLLVSVFRDVYNKLTFLNADSSFRSMTNVVRVDATLLRRIDVVEVALEATIECSGGGCQFALDQVDPLGRSLSTRSYGNEYQYARHTQAIGLDGFFRPVHRDTTGIAPTGNQFARALNQSVALIQTTGAKLLEIREIESIQELEDLGCTLPFITFESTTLIHLDFDLQQLTTAEIQVLETAFAGVYNSLSLQNCDSLGRKVTDVRIVIDDAIVASPWSSRRDRRLGFNKGGRFTAKSTIKCPCPSSSTAFTGGFGRRELEERVNQTLVWDRKLQTPHLDGCYCPVGADGTGTAPTEDEFLSQYQMAIDSIQNETNLLDGFGKITSVHEVEDLKCTLPIISLDSVVFIEVDFDTEMLTLEEIDALEVLYADVYNVMTLENCDKLGRRMVDVNLVMDFPLWSTEPLWGELSPVSRRERHLGFGKNGRFAAKSTIKCPCPKSSTTFTGRFGTRELDETTTNQTLQSHAWGRELQALPDLGGCYCPIGAGGTGTAPTEAEFLAQFQAAIESIKTHTGQLLDGFGKITSVQEVKSLNCTLPLTTLESVVIIEVDFDTDKLTLDDIDALETLYANVFNVMTFESCDSLGRRIADVSMVMNDPLSGPDRRERRLGFGTGGRFAVTSSVNCRCPKSSTAFTGRFGRRELDEMTNQGPQANVWGRKLQSAPDLGECYCPIGADGTGTAPTEAEFVAQFQAAIEWVKNETNLLSGFGNIEKLQELENLKCELPLITEEKIVVIDYDSGPEDLTPDDIERLENLIMVVYNVLSLNNCDNFGRKVVDVKFAVVNATLPVMRRRDRRLDSGRGGRFIATLTMTCHCPSSTTAFTGQFEKISSGARASEDPWSFTWDRKLQQTPQLNGCYCPFGADGTGETPTETAFSVQFQAAIQSVTNETGQLAGFEITGLTEVTPLNFSSPLATHDTAIAIVVAADIKNMADADISALESTIADVYDQLSFGKCDNLGRSVINVTVAVNDTYLGAPFYTSNDVQASTVIAFVRFGCFCLDNRVAFFAQPSDGRRLDVHADDDMGAPPPIFYRNLQEMAPKDKVHFCPAHGEGTGAGPSSSEYLDALNEAILAQQNETGLLMDLGPIANIEEIKQYSCIPEGLCNTTIEALFEGDGSEVTAVEKTVLEDTFLASFNVLSFNNCDPLGRIAILAELRVLPDPRDAIDGSFNAEFFVKFSMHPKVLNACKDPPCSNACELFQQEAPRKKRGLLMEDPNSWIKSSPSFPSFALIMEEGKHDQNGRNLQTTDDSTNNTTTNTTFSTCSCAAFGNDFSSRRVADMVQRQTAALDSTGSEGFAEPTLLRFSQEYTRAVVTLAEQGVLEHVVNVQFGVQRDDIVIPPDTCRCQAKGEFLYGDDNRARTSRNSMMGTSGSGSTGGVGRRPQKPENRGQRTEHKANTGRRSQKPPANRGRDSNHKANVWRRSQKQPANRGQQTNYKANAGRRSTTPANRGRDTTQKAKKTRTLARNMGYVTVDGVTVIPNNKYPCYLSQVKNDKDFWLATRGRGRSTPGGNYWLHNFGHVGRDLLDQQGRDDAFDEQASLENLHGNKKALNDSTGRILDHFDADTIEYSDAIKTRSLSKGSGMSSMSTGSMSSMSKRYNQSKMKGRSYQQKRWKRSPNPRQTAMMTIPSMKKWFKVMREGGGGTGTMRNIFTGKPMKTIDNHYKKPQKPVVKRGKYMDGLFPCPDYVY